MIIFVNEIINAISSMSSQRLTTVKKMLIIMSIFDFILTLKKQTYDGIIQYNPINTIFNRRKERERERAREHERRNE